MDLINHISSNNAPLIEQSLTKSKTSTKTKEKKGNVQIDITYKEQTKESSTSTNNIKAHTYAPDMDKVKAMKEETDQRMIDLFKSTVRGGTLKQLGGYRGVLEKVLTGEKIDGLDVEISITEEDIETAKAEVAEGGYWSAEETANRFIDFAKALSGDNTAKADLLIDAFKEGYAQAEELWGGELPSLSKETYDLTLQKLDEWKNESNQ